MEVYRLLTLAAACERFGLFPQRLYQLVAEGLIHPVQPRGRILYPEWELDAVLKVHTRAVELAHQVQRMAVPRSV